MASPRYTAEQREQIITAVILTPFTARAEIIQCSGRVYDQMVDSIDNPLGLPHGHDQRLYRVRDPQQLSIMGVTVIPNSAMPDDLLIGTGAEGRVVGVVRIPLAGVDHG